jgi:isoleucyl-tRNA synthetase
MHKSWGNSIEFNEGADKIGVDVMRWMYGRQNPADNMLFGYKKADEARRQFYLMLWNTYKYFSDYAKLDGFKFEYKEQKSIAPVKSQNVLDIWIFNRFIYTLQQVDLHLQNYNAKDGALEVESLVSDISTWFIRRSRNRVWSHSEDMADKHSFYETMYLILSNLSIVISPIMPFLSEEMYTTLTGKESVHLSSWPNTEIKPDELLFEDMKLIRTIAENGHKVRKELKFKVRQPLASVTIRLPKNIQFRHAEFVNQYTKLLSDELNVKKVIVESGKGEVEVSYDSNLTPELILEGELRDLIRSIQAERKTQDIDPDVKIKLTIPEKFKTFESVLLKNVSASSITYGTELKVELANKN